MVYDADAPKEMIKSKLSTRRKKIQGKAYKYDAHRICKKLPDKFLFPEKRMINEFKKTRLKAMKVPHQ